MKKILAILLTVCMVIWMIPATAFATDESGNENLIDLTQATISINNGDKDYYTAEEVKADNFLTTYSEVIVEDANKTAIPQKDTNDGKDNYVITKIKNGDKIRITINFVEGKSKGTNFKEFDIVSETLNNNDYFISSSSDAKTATPVVDSKVYTGAKITPAIYVYKKAADSKSANELVPSSKYTVEYNNNENVGTAEILVMGKGTVGGKVGGAFAITPADFSAVTVTASDTKETDANKYDVTVRLNGNTLEKGTDYTLSFKDSDGKDFTETAFEPGKKYTVVVNPVTGNFTEGSKAKEYSFKVNKDFAGATVSITNTTFTYNGQKQVPTVTVKNGSQTITKGYTVTYYNASGKQELSPTNAGSYTVVVEAVANNDQGLSGTAEAGFVIDRVDVQSTKSTDNNYVYISGLTEQKYTGRALMPSFTVYYKATPSSSAKALTKNTDYTVTYSNNTSVGTGRVAVTFTGNYRNSGSDLTGTFTISNGTLLNSFNTTISGVSDVYDYTGYAIKPNVYVTYKSGLTSKTLTQSTTTRTYDYKVDYSSNIAAGTATITVTGQGEYTGTVTKTFKIKYNLSNAAVTASPVSYDYDGRAKTPAVTVKIGNLTIPSSEYTVKYQNNTNAGTATATVTANTYGNSRGSQAVNFTIKGKTGVITPEYTVYSKKTTKSNPFTIRMIGNTTDGTGYSYTSSDTSVATVSNGVVTVKGCGRTVITITTTGNKAYEPATATVTVTVKPTKGIITSLTSTARGKMVVKYKKESPNADYYQIRYGRAGDYTVKTVKNSTALTGKSTIKNLKSGKKYYVKVRGVKELADGTVLYGAWSATKNVAVK